MTLIVLYVLSLQFSINNGNNCTFHCPQQERHCSQFVATNYDTNENCRCFCDDLCHLFNDCCNSSVSVRPSVDTTGVDQIQLSQCVEFQMLYGTLSCRMVSKCPQSWPVDDVKTQCENPPNETIRTTLPVVVSTENDVKFHYKNQYCAQCNSFDQFTPWSVVLQLKECDLNKVNILMNTFNFYDALDVLRTEQICQMFIEHPSETYECRPCICSSARAFTMPSLAVFMNFLPDNEKERDCTLYKKQAGCEQEDFECPFGKMARDGACIPSFFLRDSLIPFELLYDIVGMVDLVEAEYLSREYLNYIDYKILRSYNTEVIVYWHISIHSGTMYDSDLPCTQLRLYVLFSKEILKRSKIKTDLSELLTPCLEMNCKITFLPFNHPKRPKLCYIDKPIIHSKPDSLGMSVDRILTYISLSISVISLAISIYVYFICPIFHNLSSRNVRNLTITLLLSQLVYLVAAELDNDTIQCKVIGILNHYFWLSSFFWMFVCSVHTWLSFSLRSVVSFEQRSRDQAKLAGRYLMTGYVVPLVLVALCTVLDFVCDICSFDYGKSVCFISTPIWLAIGFAGPIGIILLLNTVFFVMTVNRFLGMQKDASEEIKRDRSNFSIFVRLSTIMGMTWIIGFLAEVFQFEWLWYIFIIVNGCQGFTVFVSFVCRYTVFDWFRVNIFKVQSNKIPS